MIIKDFLIKLFAALQIDENEASRAGVWDVYYPFVVREDQAIKLITDKLKGSADEKAIADLADTAINPGPEEFQGKLTPQERDWFLACFKDDLPAAKEFLKFRQKIVPLAARAPSKNRPPRRIDSLQATINKQVGLSEEAFHKYF